MSSLSRTNEHRDPIGQFLLSGDAVGDPKTVSELVSRSFGLTRDRIESILPSTPFQQDVMDCASNNKHRTIGHVVYEIQDTIDPTRLVTAWKEVVRQTPALRTFIFTDKGGDATFQVVLKDSFVFSWRWEPLDIKEEIIQDETAAAIAGPRCNRFILLDDLQSKKKLLIWTFSHALVDNTFQDRILRRVLKAYKRGQDEASHRPDTPDHSGSDTEDSLPSSPGELSKFSETEGMKVAIRFWQDHLKDLNASAFPHLSSPLAMPYPDAKAEHRISYSGSVQSKWPSATVCRAALAILLSRYTHSSEALFGVVTLQQPMMDGPTQTVMPIRIRCGSDQTLSDVMKAIGASEDSIRQFAHAGLRNIGSTGGDGSAACGFQTVLLVTDSGTEQTFEIHQKTGEPERFMPCANRALLIDCQMSSNGTLLVAKYDQSVIDSYQMARFLRQLGRLIQSMQGLADNLLCVSQIDMVTQEDRAEILRWNSEPIPPQDTLIHHEMLKKVVDSPKKTAVFSWDGVWTYSELDNVSSRLATLIKSIDLGKEHAIIPLYFEKSKWVIASMLAVLKAGHAFTLIDPNDPPARTSQVVKQTCATAALTSKIHYNTVQAIIGHCIVVDDGLLQSLPDEDLVTTTVKPHELAYVIFTSGSTGVPKGIMIEHQAFASSALEFGPSLGINSDTRALQFGSHAFGACLLEIMTTLIYGGCVCIPSDDDRMNNVPAFINRSKVNWMMATPSYMGTFQPEDVPELQTLVLVGEQMSPAVNDIWASRVQLLDGYGQGESSSISFVGSITPLSSDPNNMGRAVGAHCWIIDPNDTNRLVPIGAIGELVLESPGIARDYIIPPPPNESPFFTAAPTWYPSKQLPEGLKFYRTGDLARYASDGTIVCLGRMDSQVKIRGQRVELGAVETHLRQQIPDDTSIVVEAVKRSVSSSGTVLVAFLIGSMYEANGRILGQNAAGEINTKLEQVLPKHSIPSCYVCLENLPRTATGKVDRRRIRAIGNDLLNQRTHGSTPQPNQGLKSSATDADAKLKEIWLRSLNLESGSTNLAASFFELGGNSIIAIKMVNMARSAGIELKVSDIYQNPTLAGLGSVIHGTSAPYTYTVIPKSVHQGPVDQSYSQGRLWFLDQLEVGALWYLIPYAVRMRGSVDINSLSYALLALEQRHETLRTTFEDQDGMGVQIVHQTLAKELRVVHVSESSYLEFLHQEQTAPFDLRHEAGWRALMMRVGETDYVLSIVMHHIISDGWSIDILRRDLSQLYAAALQGEDPLSALNLLPIQYRDFAMWQKQESQMAQHEKQLKYWQKQLADCSPAKIPTDFPRPDLLSGEAGGVPVTIDGTLYQKLRDFCNRNNTTSFSVLLAAFRATHYRLTGVDDAAIGTPIANRNRHELENIIGFFVNTQCMRITVDDDDTFETLVRQVRSTTTAAFENEDVPFERVVSAMHPGSRDLSRSPLVQLMFAVHSQKDLGRFELQGLESEPIPAKAYTRFDIEFHLFQEADRLNGSVNFAAELFKLKTIQNVVSVFFQVLCHGLDQSQTPISVVPLTDGVEELRRMDLLNIKHVDYPRDLSLVDLFREQVATCSDSLAVVDSSSRLTYAELDRQSDLLAAWLRGRGMAAETLVGVLAPRSCETVVAFLGILKANMAYLPLDVRSPTARVKDILSGLPGHRIVLLGTGVDAPELPLPDREMVQITDALQYQESKGPSGYGNAYENPSATSLAYVLFTSGSTGRPKGVMVEHRSIVRLVKSDIIPDFPPAARLAHMFNIAFDGATWEIFVTLLNGGTLVCVDYMTSLDCKALTTLFAKEQVNAVMMAPALIKLYLADARDALKGLDLLLAGGDRFDGHDAIEARALVRGRVCNAYGPTENGVMSTLYCVTANESFINGVPIGRAVNNSGAYVTDRGQQLVGVGVMGELVVTGDGLARGYFDPTLDKNRFVHISVDGQKVRAYRTGDRVRYRTGDGLIEFFGRMDTQFKIRGNRIESAEVESAMLSHPSVRDAAVVVVGEGQKEEMAGFIVVDLDHSEEQEETVDQVRGWQDQFESGTYADISTISTSSIGKDFKGWTSMYDGSDIDKAEMQEWLDDTMQTLYDGQKPRHVLEIGTGSGMILFNLGERLQSYVGLEPSKSAVDFTNSIIDASPDFAGKAKVHVGTATDVGKLSGIHPEVVVLNSVVQYFPSPEYLAEVVDSLVHIPGVKRLFFGDIRSQATNRHFLAARAIHKLGNNATKDSVRQKIAELEEREEEFLVEPAFFTTLADQFPDLVKHVEILPKNMQATNELSAYRYTAVVHLRDPGESAQPVHSVEEDDWVDFEASQMDKNALLDHLRLSRDAVTVAIGNIPFAKTAFDRQIVKSLDDDSRDETQRMVDGAAWISGVRSDAQARPSLSVPDLFQLANSTGFSLEVSAARQWSQNGALDAVFHRYPSSQEGSRTHIRFPTDNQARVSATLATRPLQGLQRRRAALQVRERLQSLVPSYMIPPNIVVLDQMPLNANGKVDRKELARRARIMPKHQTAPTAPAFPIGEIEVVLCEAATKVFGTNVAISDDFFNLGGNSLMASKLIAKIGHPYNIPLSVRDVFETPIFADLSVVIRKGLASSTHGQDKDKQGRPARMAPRTETEMILCEEWSKLLDGEVGINDDFFFRGGNSIKATTLANRINYRLGSVVSAPDVFNYPVLFQLAKKIDLAVSDSYDNGIQMEDYTLFQLLSVQDSQAFIQEEICSRLGISYDTIQDMYPATAMQKLFLCDGTSRRPRPLTPFYIDFPAGSDPTSLIRACESLVKHVDMFRTVLVETASETYQVVLKHLDVPIDIVETEPSMTTPTAIGQSLIRIAILRQTSSLRVFMQLSHALYDGLSLAHIVRNLHMLFSGKSISSPAQFGRYMQYAADSRLEGYDFWRRAIGGSPMTLLSKESNGICQPGKKALSLTKIVAVPLKAMRNSIATQATVFSSACALVMSKESESSDVVFGRIVSGRQGLPGDWQEIIGPCTNAVPVRAHIDKDTSHQQLLRDMQDQYLRSLPFETLGFEEIKRNCTDWLDDVTNYGCCITYQNFEYNPESSIDQERVEMGVVWDDVKLRDDEPIRDDKSVREDKPARDDDPLYDFAIAGEVEPNGVSLKVSIIARSHLFSRERAEHLLEEICKAFEHLNSLL
jgi:amino acid adenylation domain-containing protein